MLYEAAQAVEREAAMAFGSHNVREMLADERVALRSQRRVGESSVVGGESS